ncbi:MAG: hypothetical protein KAR79_05355, partial [Simkaniaceae bacterium]|nr:hypothetical protein [Simkaniaceae bacterium]
MGEIEIKLPKLGESIVSAKVVQWFKKEGDFVKADEPLLEVSTDKINSEIPSPESGTLVKIVAQPDEELDVGENLGILSTDSAESVQPQEKKIVSERKDQGSSHAGYFSPALLTTAR